MDYNQQKTMMKTQTRMTNQRAAKIGGSLILNLYEKKSISQQ